MSNNSAVLALSTAISANSCAVGFTLIAQSENKYLSWSRPRIIKKAPLVRLTPGFVLMICNAGRTVSPVEWIAPLTIPSAIPM